MRVCEMEGENLLLYCIYCIFCVEFVSDILPMHFFTHKDLATQISSHTYGRGFLANNLAAFRRLLSSMENNITAAGNSSNETKTHFRVCRFIIETGVKLGMRSVPVATACSLYHKFFQTASLQVYEPYLVAMSCIYLAGKVEEQHLRTRDIINVCHRYFHPGSDPLELNEKFWELRDSVVQCELLILRQLNFHVSFEHPHKYLLHYLLSVRSLMNRHAWSRTPIAETAWALIKDSYHGPVCVRHQPQHLALTALYLALHTYGVQVPAGERDWWQVVCEDITKAQIEAIMTELLQLYDMEAKCT